MPTLALVKDGKTRDYVVGFTDLGKNFNWQSQKLTQFTCQNLLNRKY